MSEGGVGATMISGAAESVDTARQFQFQPPGQQVQQQSGQQFQQTGQPQPESQATDTPWYSAIQDPEVKNLMARSEMSPEQLAYEHYRLLKKHEGRPGAVAIPGQDATPEERDAFYTALGRPKTPEGYALTVPETLQDGGDLQTKGRSVFHEAGLSVGQAQHVWDAFIQLNQEYADAQVEGWKQQGEAAIEKLKAQYKNDFPEFLERGKSAVQALGLPAEAVTQIEAAIGTHALLSLFSALGARLQEGQFVAGGAPHGGIPPEQMTDRERSNAVSTLYGDPMFQKAFRDSGHPQHADAVKRFSSLFVSSSNQS